MESQKIWDLAKELSENVNVSIECNKGSCEYEKSNDKFCCQEGAYYKIQALLEKGINEGIRKDATTIPTEDDKKKMYNVQLQHDGHNELDRLNDALYRLDTFNRNKDNAAPSINFVTAEYMRTAIQKFRFILNELYLNNKINP